VEVGVSIRVTAPVDLPDEVVDELVRRTVAALAERQADEPEPWLNVNSAAAYLDCTPRRIYDLVEQGRLTPMRDGRRLLFRRQWLDAALDAET
jgi:excisionase family DNA binding protein